MTIQILIWFGIVKKILSKESGRVLEIGSRNINGSVRQFFKDATEYIGIDMEAGEGVDLVLNASESLNHFGADSFETIICSEMLEHDVDFMGTINQIHHMLKPDGILYITTPTFGFPLHRYPKDYWRFGEDAYREAFFKGFDIINLCLLDNDAGPKITLACVGKKLAQDFPEFDDQGNRRTINSGVDPGWERVH